MWLRTGWASGLGLILLCCGRVEQSSSQPSSCPTAAPSCDDTGCAPGELCGGGPNGGSKNSDGGSKNSDAGSRSSDAGSGGGRSSNADGGRKACDGGTCGPPHVCEPQSERCVGTQLSQCDADGAKWLTPVACEHGQLCIDGSCKLSDCEPHRWYCRDGGVYQCDEDGKFGSIVKACDPELQRCVANDDGSLASCVDGCQPGAKVCIQNGVGTCSDDGSLPKSSDPCGSNEHCQAGECKPLGCEVLGITQACIPLPCVPGEKACVLDRVGTCAADGRSLSATSEDCRAQGNVCTSDLTCAKSYIDIIGPGTNGEKVPADVLVANVIAVRTPRKLIELQTWTTPGLAARQMHWVAYELVGNTFIQRQEQLVSDFASVEFHSSGYGSFSLQLESGKTYLLGLVVHAAEATRAYQATRDTAPLSFGIVQGSVSAPYATSIALDANSLRLDIAAHLRVTTAAP